MRSRLPAIIGGIVGASILAFLCGLILTVMVIMPAREPLTERASPTPEPTIGPHVGRTPLRPSPSPTYVVIILTPDQPRATPTPAIPSPSASVATAPAPRPTIAPSRTPTPRFPFYYVEGSMVPAENCFSQYLQGWIKDGNGTALNGITVRWEYWNKTEFAISADPRKVWQPGEWKFTYYAEDPSIETDFVLEVVESEQNPIPLSQPLVIHYGGCFESGQITNIVFKQY
jgi:hypothetical protein